MGTVEVCIRSADEAESVHLTDVPFDELDTVIPTIRKWGIQGDFPNTISGQFVVGEDGAYFEVVFDG